MSGMNLEILMLYFENKNYFDVSLKQFAFEILQLPDYYFFWKRDYLLLCLVTLSLVKVRHEVIFCFCGFQSEGLKKRLEVLFEKILSFF